MKNGWQKKALGEVCEFLDRRGVTPEKLGSRFESDGFRVISAKNIKERQIDPNIGEQRFVDEPTYRRWMKSSLLADDVILTSEAPLGEPAYVEQELEWCLGQRLFGVRSDKTRLNGRFLFYAFQASPVRDDMLSRATGATAQGIRQSELTKVEIPIPPLAEQQRIVGLLDEAFAGLATAQAHAEKNLQNARALFESHLQSVFTQRGEGWTERTLGDVFTTATGTTPSKNNSDFYGDFMPLVKPPELCDEPFDSAGDGLSESGAAVARTLPPKSILVSCIGNLGKIGLNTVPVAFNQQINAILPNERQAMPGFMFFQALAPAFKQQLESLASGTTVPIVNKSKFNSVRIVLPSLLIQKSVVGQLTALREETQRLATIYSQKLAAVAALKQSLLHQAFSGQLTSGEVPNAIQQPARQTKAPKFAASVVALAHARHERQEREKTFGRVKEQKVLQMVESLGKIDLGREPMKDAAGPNDFQHMLKVEEWAKANHYFEMVKCGEGYEFKKLKLFDKLLADAGDVLGPHLLQVEHVIDLLIPMDTKDAEVFATVHAAWNNLLIDGMEATDDAILRAAREGWHPDKLQIPVKKFKDAIQLIRHKCLVPDGTAKYVRGQNSLL